MRESFRFWKRRSLSAAALIVSIGLAAAVATTTVAVARAVLWQDLPVRDPSRIVTIRPVVLRAGEPLAGGFVLAQEFVLWKERQDVFDDLAAYQAALPTDLVLAGRVEDITAVRVSANVFDLLDVRAVAGRLLTARDDEEGRHDLAVLSYAAWTRLYGRDPSVIGRAGTLVERGDEVPVTIIGVAPPGLDHLDWSVRDGVHAELFTLLPERASYEDPMRAIGWRVIGRLRYGVTGETARARMLGVVVDSFRTVAPSPSDAAAGGNGVSAFTPVDPSDVHITTLHEELYGGTRPLVRLLLAIGALVILITCVSAGGTMVLIAGRRARDTAIQCALGRSVGNLRECLLLEGLALGLLAGMVSWLAARVLVAAVLALGPTSVPRMASAQIGGIEAAVASLLALGCGLMLGIVSAGVLPVSTFRALKEGGATTMSRPVLRFRQVLLGVQLALVLVLLVMAGLMLGTLRTLVNRPLGFSPEQVVVAQVRTPWELLSDAEGGARFVERLRLSASQASEGRTVALAFEAPLNGIERTELVRPVDERGVHVAVERVGSGYFEVLGIPILAGRDFSPGDDSDVLVVNESFAREYFGSPIAAVGRRMQRGNRARGPVQIVGVAADTRHHGLRSRMQPLFYRPLVDHAGTSTLPTVVRVLTRATGDIAGAAERLRQAAQQVDPRVSVRAELLMERYREQTAKERLLAVLLGTLAGSTLFLSLLGVVTLVGQLAADRMRELAIRLVLGSSPGATVWLVVRAVTAPAVAGILVGLVLAWWGIGLISQFLFEIAPYDFPVWATAIAVLAGTSAMGAWWPARRALRLEPARILRTE